MNEQLVLKLIGRERTLFESDLQKHEDTIREAIASSTFLVIGGAGSIGRGVVKELFLRDPKRLCVVDLSENNLAELVRDLRSSIGYTSGVFHAYCMNGLEQEFDSFCKNEGPFDYVLNFAALKHVRSEKDPYTLMRLIRTNTLLPKKTLEFANQFNSKKYFCVSTDKATAPVNMMGASKRIMELFLLEYGQIPVSTARFANVAFSEGSLLDSFRRRLSLQQPLAGPNDIKRYFITVREAAILCLISIFLGNKHDIMFPQPDRVGLEQFDTIGCRLLEYHGLKPLLFDNEQEARDAFDQLDPGYWPCYFSGTNTTGEKSYEEFYLEGASVDRKRFDEIGVLTNMGETDHHALDQFLAKIDSLRKSGSWNKSNLLEAFRDLVPEFVHEEKNRNLDQKM